MDNPKFEAELTSEQFHVFMAAMNQIHSQQDRGKSGEINLLDNFVISWEPDTVKFEVKANEV